MANIDARTQLWGRLCLHNKFLNQAQWEECLALYARAQGQTPIEDILVKRGYIKDPAHVPAIGKKVNELLEKQGIPASGAAPAARPAPAAAAPPSSGRDGLELASGTVSSSRNAPLPTADPSQFKPGEKPVSKIIKSTGDILPSLKGPKLVSPVPYVPVPEDEKERIPCPVQPNQLDPMAVEFIKEAIKIGASDMHLSAGSPPFYRLNGQLIYSDNPPLTPEQAQKIVLGFMDDKQQQHFLRNHDLDFSYDNPSIGRFRANALEQFRGPNIIFRYIPPKIPTLASLGLPESLGKFTEWHQGLVLVTGSAGCGKSTTAAALVDLVNTHRKDHVITVEDPVEYLHKSKNCNVTQRQVPNNTKSFAAALKGALREDPDVIMIGDMRDLETVSLAIRAAETGHLVIGTLQTKSAARTVDRVIDVFPSDQQGQIRTMLSESLRGIITQQLVPTADGKRRVVALEVLYVNLSVSNAIRDSKTFQLNSIMQTSKKLGQKLMDDSLEELVQSGTITRETAMRFAEQPKRFAEKKEPETTGKK